jgi:hypothetical protein
LRAFFIRKILDARFSVSAPQEWKSDHPEAMRERQRLEAATEGELIAELTDLGALGPPPRLGGTPA